MDLGGRLAGIRNEAYVRLVRHLGLDCPTEGIKICPFLTAQEPDRKLLEALGTDFYWLNVNGPEYVVKKRIDEEAYVNEWGITVKIVDHYAQRIVHPLKDAGLEEIAKYDWPDPQSDWRYEGIEERAAALHEQTDFALALNPISGGIFEMCQHLRGLDNFFVDLMLNKEFAHALLDRVLEIEMRMTERYLEKVGRYIEVVALSDDYASAQSLLVSPQVFDEFFKPRYARFTEMIKSKTDGKAKVMLHSCGAISGMIDRFIEMGIDILNPLQPTAKGMDPKLLKDTYGKNLCFHGGIDSQFILATGTEDEVRRHKKEVVEVLASSGGYILAPSHQIQFHVPPENIVAMYE